MFHFEDMEALKLHQNKHSVQSYFEIDAAAELRCEYFDGEIVAIAGLSLRHNEISGNVFTDLHGQIRKKAKGCKTFISDARLQIAEKNSCYYPDVMVACNPTDLANNRNIENPTLVVEVLSESTQSADLTTKLSVYMQIPNLQYYMIVSQIDTLVLLYERQQEFLALHIYDELSQEIKLTHLGVNLSLSGIYA